jgi:uncharacterized oxidoreductase
MKMTNNTILITGGGSGIGRALAEAFHKLGNQVIIAGRTSEKLDETTGANPGIESFKADTASLESIKFLASEVTRQFPQLDTVIHCAGVMIAEDLLNGKNFQTDEATVNTNLLGPIRLTEELLPVLKKQSSAAILTVSSGLAFVPMAMTPTYCATKAAIHSYTESLRYQLRNTAIQVIELIPPYVATYLMGDYQANDPNAMPLGDYISETMGILKTQPDATEVLVERVRPLRFSAEEGQEKYEQFFKEFNDQMTAAFAAAANTAH